MTAPVLPRAYPNASAPGAPQFAMAMRGYDRGQVDDYIARINDFLADAEQRATHAEGSTADLADRNDQLAEDLQHAIERRSPQHSGSTYDGLGERIAEILRLAAEEADALRRQARLEAETLVSEAALRRETERESFAQELTDMTARRDAVVAELRRVQDVLSTLGLGQHVLPPEAVEAAATAEDPLIPEPAAAAGQDAGFDDAETRVIRLPTVAATS